MLIDGGILNPTPIEPTLKDQTDITIAVNLGGLPEKKMKKIEKQSDFQIKWNEFVDNLKFSKSKSENEWDMLYIADQSFNTMQNALASQKMSVNPPDFLVDIPRNKCGTLEFERAVELIDFGYESAQQQLKGLLK